MSAWILIVVLVVLILWWRIDKRRAGDGDAPHLGVYLKRGLVIVLTLVVLGAMSNGCDEEPDPGEPGAPVERVTCGAYRAEDCPPVTPAPPPSTTAPPATPNTTGIPAEVPA